jgi:hypothetical protein
MYTKQTRQGLMTTDEESLDMQNAVRSAEENAQRQIVWPPTSQHIHVSASIAVWDSLR